MSGAEGFDLTVRRVIRAPRQKVFEAFVTPALFRQWMGPRSLRVTALEMDPRIGGRYRTTLRSRTGEEATFSGVYTDIAPPERVAFTWKWEGDQEVMGQLPETLVTVCFIERQGDHGVETEVTLRHSGFPSSAARDLHDFGWNSCLYKLSDFSDARGTASTLTLIGDPRSTYVRTARLALSEKGLEYAFDPAPPHSERVNAISPHGRIPVFRDGDITIFETSAIVRYLEESFDGPPLVSSNPRLRAQMEQWISMINCHCYDAMVRRYVLQYVFPKGEGGSPDYGIIGAALPEIELQLAALDKAYGTREFLVGETPTMADLFLAPIVFYLAKFPESKALLHQFTNLQRGHAAMADRKSFLGTMPQIG